VRCFQIGRCGQGGGPSSFSSAPCGSPVCVGVVPSGSCDDWRECPARTAGVRARAATAWATAPRHASDRQRCTPATGDGGALPGSAAHRLAAGALPLFSEAPRRRILCVLQLVEALADGLRRARPDPRDVLDPAMPQLGRLAGGLSTAILFRPPPEAPPPLPCALCYRHVPAVLLASASTP